MYIKPIYIGDVKVENNVFLAPMAGVTDIAFRSICREFGAGMIYTEMASSKAVHYGSEKTENIYEILEDEHPIGIQIFGHEPEIMAETAEKLSNIADIIDINMGCPAPKIVKNGEGAALLKDLKLAEKIIKSVVSASKVPVTVKFRKGYDGEHINAVDLACIAEENGAKLITIHGRTREQMYTGKVDYEIIKQVKEAVKIPVVGNGDIFDEVSAKRMFDETGCDGIMVARGSQGNPWIFKDIIEYLSSGEIGIKPSTKEKINMILKHLDLAVKYKGEYIAVREMRKHIAWYLKGINGAAKVKELINREQNLEKVKEILNKSSLEGNN